MSRKPNPAALTAATLMAHAVYVHGIGAIDYMDVARAASDLHRLAKATKRQAEAECNGEFYIGQRRMLERSGNAEKLDKTLAKTGERLDRRIAKLNQSLAELSVMAYREGDPRGYTLRLRSTEPTRPMPSNGMEQGEWGIV